MSIRLNDIARLIGAEIPRNMEKNEILRIASIQDAGPNDVSFLSNPRYARYIDTTHAAAVIVSKDIVVPESVVPLKVDEPYVAFLKVLKLFNNRSPSDIASGIDPDACIHPEAEMAENVSIGPHAVIGPGVRVGEGTIIGPCSVILKNSTIGKNCIIYPNVTVMDDCVIGNNVSLFAGVVIGADGFGFAPEEGMHSKIPQIGRVLIGDNVEIGACSCVDRAAFGETVIESGTKIDNLVQVGHNVHIGSNTVIAAQVGIAGSATIGKGVKIGGQAGISGHLQIGDGASIGGQSGVTKNVPDGETVSGYPARNHVHALRLDAALRSLPDLIKKIKAQEKRINELERVIKMERS